MNSSFLRISGTLKELRIVASTARAPRGYSMTWQVPPAASMAARADLEKPCACTVSGLLSSPRPSTLTGMSRRVASPADLSAATIDRRAGLEARVEVAEVDRLRVRPEHLERHRHLLVRPAQLAHAHVDRRLAALEALAVLGAGARAVALVAAPGGLAVARSRGRGRRACGSCASPARAAGCAGRRSARRLLQAGSRLLLDDDRGGAPSASCRAAGASRVARRRCRSCAARASAACRAGGRSSRWRSAPA